MKALFIKNRNSGNAGFLIIELIVALSIFGVVMAISIGSLITALDSNRKAQALQSVMNNLEVVLDTMSSSIATGRYFRCDGNINTLAPGNNVQTLDCPIGSTATDHHTITFISNENLDGDDNNYDGITYRYNVDANGVGYIERNRYFTRGGGSWVPWTQSEVEGFVRMTAPDVNITDLEFYVTGAAQNYHPGGGNNPIDYEQPKVLIVVKGSVNSGSREAPTEFSLQLTTTQLLPDF